MKITRLETELYIAPPPERPITDALRANRHPGRVLSKCTRIKAWSVVQRLASPRFGVQTRRSKPCLMRRSRRCWKDETRSPFD